MNKDKGLSKGALIRLIVISDLLMLMLLWGINGFLFEFETDILLLISAGIIITLFGGVIAIQRLPDEAFESKPPNQPEQGNEEEVK